MIGQSNAWEVGDPDPDAFRHIGFEQKLCRPALGMPSRGGVSELHPISDGRVGKTSSSCRDYHDIEDQNYG